MRAKGLSLLEVVVSLLLIATTASALLAAHGRSLEQLSETRHQETAAALASELITGWKLDPPETDVEMTGRFESYPAWRWSRTAQPYPLTMQSELWEVTLTIHQTDDRGKEHEVRRYTWLERSHER